MCNLNTMLYMTSNNENVFFPLGYMIEYNMANNRENEKNVKNKKTYFDLKNTKTETKKKLLFSTKIYFERTSFQK